MKTNTRWNTVSCFLIIMGIVFPLSFSWGQAQSIPVGEGFEKVAIACTQCHGLDLLTRVTLNADEWENALYDMMARGAVVEEQDLVDVREYLINSFATDK